MQKKSPLGRSTLSTCHYICSSHLRQYGKHVVPLSDYEGLVVAHRPLAYRHAVFPCLLQA